MQKINAADARISRCFTDRCFQHHALYECQRLSQQNHCLFALAHIRIEDIVAHTLIRKDEQVFFAGDYQKKVHAPIITTGNELVKEEIADFSKELDIAALYEYIMAVDASTEATLREMAWSDLKIKMTNEDKEKIRKLHVVSEDEKAIWLIDYWCGKSIQGLIRMPLSRHWIMHVEAALRIANNI